MATHNHTWGEERIAELRVKLALTVSPRTVRRYMPPRPRSCGGRSAQSWATFVHNHAGSILACERPHSALGPGLPNDPTHQPALTGHRIPAAFRVVANARLGGLHHHYLLEPIAA
jgi:hypothetical protein